MSDEIIEKIGGKECINAAVGDAVTMVLCDTNNCFHAGSRKAANRELF